MYWLKSSTDGNGINTFFPPMPCGYEKIPKCSQCGGLTQFLHFFPEVLRLLKPEDLVPSFCSGTCAGQFIIEKRTGVKIETNNT